VKKILVLLLASVLGCGQRTATTPIPAGIVFVPRAAWGAQPPVLPMKEHVPVRITIHHTGTNQSFTRTLEAKIKALQEFSQRDDSLSSGKKKPAWADVPYHYYVSVDGRVAEGREWRYAGDSNTPYDPTGHLLVVVEGNFQRDTLTSAQSRTIDLLIPALAKRFHIPSARLASHKDYAETDCPGENLYRRLPALRALIDGTKNINRDKQ
jgi:hypothetical protein